MLPYGFQKANVLDGMKGIIFREFFELVEKRFSFETLDSIIEEADLPSKGAYASAGTYPHEELVTVLVKLSQRTGLSTAELLKVFGEHMITVFKKKFPSFFSKSDNPLDFLEGVDGYVHVEVRKLYSDVELPRFICERTGSNTLTMDYYSTRHLEDLAEGLICGLLKDFNRHGDVTRTNVVKDGKECVRFNISLHP